MIIVTTALTIAGTGATLYMLARNERAVASLFVLATLVLVGVMAYEGGLLASPKATENDPVKSTTPPDLDITAQERHTIDALNPLLSAESCRESDGPLQLWIHSASKDSGMVTVNGVDALRPNYPFTWLWGDGTSTTGWLPQTHHYRSQQSYTVRVISHEDNGSSHCAQIKIF